MSERSDELLGNIEQYRYSNNYMYKTREELRDIIAELEKSRDALQKRVEELEDQLRWRKVEEELPERETVYGDFFDKAVIALGYSSAMLPGKGAEDKLLKRISDLFWLVRNLSDALDCTYNRLPSHWRELPFSYYELKRKVKEVMK